MKRLGQPQSYEWKDMAARIEDRGVAGEPIFVQSGLGESFLIPGFYLDPVFLDYAACRLGRLRCPATTGLRHTPGTGFAVRLAPPFFFPTSGLPPPTCRHDFPPGSYVAGGGSHAGMASGDFP